MRRLASLALVAVLAPLPALAQSEQYHGVLSMRPARGTIDRTTGSATVKLDAWSLILYPESNGIAPDVDVVTVGVSGITPPEEFGVPAGEIRAARNGKVWRYKAPRGTTRGVRALRIWLRPDGSYGIRCTLAGVNLSLLRREDPVCISLAVVIGDDDFFTKVDVTSPSFASRRVRVRTASANASCGDDWPWLR